MVVAAVLRARGRGIGCVRGVFEEEDDAVEGLEGEELRGVEGQKLFELYIFDAEVLDQRGEDALTSDRLLASDVRKTREIGMRS